MNHFFSIIFLFVVAPIYGQELHFDHFEPSQTLPSSETYHILQDSKGYIWITTDAGISRYDGNKLETFTIENGISENVVFNVYEDVHGRIWFSTLSGYIFYYSNGRFTQIEANKELKKICSTYQINSLFIGANDTLYCSAVSVYELLRIPPQNNYRQVIQQNPYVKSCNRFIFQNPIKPMEIMMGLGKEKLNPTYSSYTVRCMNEIFTVPITKLIKSQFNKFNTSCDKEGNIYFPTGNTLTVIRKKNHALENYYFPQYISCIYCDKEGDLWIGIKKGGGYLYKGCNLRSEPVRFLYPYTISDILMDKEGSVWVCTLEKGLFQCFAKAVSDIYIPNEKVTGIESKDNYLLAGLSSNKIFLFSKKEPGYTEKKIRPLSNDFLDCFYAGDKGIYFGTNSHLFYSDSISGLPSDALFKDNPIEAKRIIPLSEDTVLIVSARSVFIVYKNKILENIALPFQVNCAYKFKNNDVLIGSRNGIGIYLLKNRSLSPFLEKYSELKTRINWIKEDLQGNLWVATNEKGLFCIKRNGDLYHYSETNGLASNKVNIFDFDEHNNTIWIGTNKGLSKLIFADDIKKTKISNFNKSHGIPALEISQLIFFEGKVWCGAKEHLFYFNPEEMKLNFTNPFIYIKSVLINGRSCSSFASPVLNYNENNINIEFESVTFKSNEQRDFIYKLEGYDHSWKYSGTGNVQYTNLANGNYHFLVYGLNNDKLKSSKPAEFSFEIKKPFWFYWWFVFFEGSILIFVIYISARSWSTKIKKREAEKTLLNQKIAEFHMTAIRAQMNPHFVFNAISSIQHYILKNDPYQSYNYLAKFSLLIRNVLDNSQEEYIPVIKEMETLRLYMELEQIRFKEPFELVIEIDEKLNTEENYIPTMLIQPYIENAIWHGLMPKQDNCKLSIVLQKQNDNMEIIITDNGIGREASAKIKGDQQHASKGMALSDQRLEALKIKNEKTFSVKIIDLKNEDRSAAGTQIIITIPIIEF